MILAIASAHTPKLNQKSMVSSYQATSLPEYEITEDGIFEVTNAEAETLPELQAPSEHAKRFFHSPQHLVMTALVEKVTQPGAGGPHSGTFDYMPPQYRSPFPPPTPYLYTQYAPPQYAPPQYAPPQYAPPQYAQAPPQYAPPQYAQPAYPPTAYAPPNPYAYLQATPQQYEPFPWYPAQAVMPQFNQIPLETEDVVEEEEEEGDFAPTDSVTELPAVSTVGGADIEDQEGDYEIEEPAAAVNTANNTLASKPKSKKSKKKQKLNCSCKISLVV